MFAGDLDVPRQPTDFLNTSEGPSDAYTGQAMQFLLVPYSRVDLDISLGRESRAGQVKLPHHSHIP
jgi:hypothetical protein